MRSSMRGSGLRGDVPVILGPEAALPGLIGPALLPSTPPDPVVGERLGQL
jgi:hypothetical protein